MSVRKGLMIFFISILGAFLFTACQDSQANNNHEGDLEKSNSEETPTISMMAKLHTPEAPDTTIREIVEEKTNVTLDIEYLPNNNYNEKLNTAFATGTLPQVVSIGSEQLDQFREAIRDEQFWEVGPYLGDYEHLSKLKDPIIENSMIDGKVYSLYQGRPLSRMGIVYRKDWADQLGLEAPTTTDEVFEMARAFTEDDPNQSGKDDTVGIADGDGLYWGAFKLIASWFGTPNNWGEQDGELLPEFMFPEYLEAMNYMKDLRDNGYINQDFPITSKEDEATMIKNGTAGMRIGGIADVVSLYNDAKEINPDIEYDVHNYIEGPQGEYGTWAIPGYGSLLLFPKSAVETEAELKEILEFYDQMMTPEIANLFYWGVEDEHYTVKNDQAIITDDQAKFDREVKPYLSLEIGEPETNGRYEGFHDYEPHAKAQELFKDNEDYLIHDPSINLESETFSEQGDRLQEIINDATTNYILGELDEGDFYNEIEKWKKQGGEDIIAEYNESWQAQNK